MFNKGGKNMLWEELSSQTVLGKLDSYMQKNETGPLSNTIHNNKLKMDVKPETIKILEENISGNFSDISHSNIFLGMSLKARKTKVKINYWDYNKIKSFCTVKEIINKAKRQPTEWEKIFANNISNKGLISKICVKNSKNSIKKSN